MHNKPLYFLFISLLPAWCTFSQVKTVTYYKDEGDNFEEKVIDARHLEAKVNIDPYTRKVTGNAVFQFIPLRTAIDSMVFNATDLSVEKVTINQYSVSFKKAGDDLIIFPEKSLTGNENTIEFLYTADNPRYLYFTGWDDPKGLMRKEVWAHRPFSWLPYLTARLTVDLHITFDSRCKVFSNGITENITDNKDGTTTWHYHMPKPHPFFSTALVIGDYLWKNDSTAGKIPLEYWYYPDQSDRVETTYRFTPQMFSFFEEELGMPYPWDLYREAPVADYLYGAMETTTSTIFGDYMFVNERAWWMRNYVNVNAHELAHQWFGNYISHVPGNAVWLTESFATYYAKLFERSIYGDDFYQNERLNETGKAFELSAVNDYPLSSGMAGVQRWYQKGSLVLDMLRYVMGDEAFRKAITHYLNKFRYTDASTHDFEQAVWEASGMSLNWFFDEWVHRGGEPEYSVSWVQQPDELGNKMVKVLVEQVQPVSELTPLFKMPVNIEVWYQNGAIQKKKVWTEKQHEEFTFASPDKTPVSFILFDPGRNVLKKVRFSRNFNQLADQALRASQMIDRYDALVALRDTVDSRKRTLLLSLWKKESFHLMKGEIVAQLAAWKDPEVFQLLREAIADTHALVRRAVLTHIKEVPQPIRKEYEKLLGDMDYQNVEYALENLCKSFPGKRSKYLHLTRNETGWRGKNIRMKWLEIAIAGGEKKYLNELIDYSGQSYEFETRKNALETLKRLNYLDETVAKNLLAAAAYWNFKLSASARQLLENYRSDQPSWNLILKAYQINAWSDSEKSILREILKIEE